MMDKKLCFIINNNELYLEKVLVCFNNMPIFFTCSDTSHNRYLVLCSDLDALEYIVEKPSTKILWEMLTQKVSMRSALQKCESFWLIRSGETISDDIVEELPKEQLDIDVLPNDGAMYEKINEEDSRYVEEITSAYLKEMKFDINNVIKDISDISVETILSISGALKSIVKYYQDFGPAIESCLKTAFSDSDLRKTVEKQLSYTELSEQSPAIELRLDTVLSEVNEIDDFIIIAA